jgi:hypothetical protein
MKKDNELNILPESKRRDENPEKKTGNSTQIYGNGNIENDYFIRI